MSQDLWNLFTEYGLITLNQFKRPKYLIPYFSYWFTSSDLGLAGIWEEEWRSYVQNLNLPGICISGDKENLVWAKNPSTG